MEQNNIQKIIKSYNERYELLDNDWNNKIFITKHTDNNFYITMNFDDSDCFYLFDSKTCDDDFNLPIAQIKYIPNLFDDKRIMFIRRLEFINNNYSKKGLASLLIQSFEKFCAKNGFASITGEFEPLHNVAPEIVEKFYHRNGYLIKNNQDGKPMIYKIISKNENKNENSDIFSH